MDSEVCVVDGAPPCEGNMNAPVERLTVDRVLEKWVGQFGWGQFWLFVSVSVAWTIEATHTLVMIFADKKPEWRCTLQPPNSTRTACSPSVSICDMDPSQWEWVRSSSTSTVSQFGLICGQHYKVGLVQSCFFVGCLIGAGVFGNLSDSFLGRKGSLLLACGLTGLTGIATALSPNYYTYLVTRGVAGISVGGVGLSSFVLATEPVGPSKRGSVGMCAFYFYSVGVMSLSAMAYCSHSWRSLYIIISVGSLVYCCSVLPFVSESPRWYLVKGRVDDAMVVLRALAKRNGRTVPSGVTLVTDEELESQNPSRVIPEPLQAQQGGGNKAASGNLIDVFILPATRWRMVIMIFIWFTCAMVYYGLNLNVVNLGFNLYLGVFLNGLVELPAYGITAALLGRVGRRMMVILAMLLSGVSCLLGALFHDPTTLSDPQELGAAPIQRAMAPLWAPTASQGSEQHRYAARAVARLVCGMIGIFGMAGSFNLIFIYTCELFPTVVRNSALGLATQAGHIGSITAPMIAGLSHYNSILPFLAFGVPAVLAGLSAIGLPETLNQPLWDTMEEVEHEARRTLNLTVQIYN